MKRKLQKRYILFLVLFLLVIGSACTGYLVYHSRHTSQSAYNPTALLTLSSRGGMCNGPCQESVDNLYDNGTFQRHKKLTLSEVAGLKRVIAATDFTAYGLIANPKCQSFVDGQDQVLLFPQKYGDKAFIPCTLDIPANDKAFSYINNLLATH